ncbi:MAG: DNA primase [Devosia sp. 67-54]|uniref:DNA primase n=1 Tax=unclassified Devosia TaxID=196773 RepID=UPI0009685CAD|nr:MULTISPECIES: DNA primase [unclassified Devosia]MBN9303765.1 DNA primase [Devosia sp.]OJX17637.1 MAG: DNA primase [Devosia sp. 67-54]
MRFSDGFLDEIRQRLPISQVVGEHVIWDKRKSQPGRGDFWACCPFHGEKTPSFHADDRKGIYHCFGCGVTGDHFRFLTEKAGMSFPEAVEKLAGMAGVPMPARDEREEARQEARRSLFDVMEVAAKYFEAALAHNIGARARGYLFERGVSAQAQTRFRIGFAPDSRNGLKEHLAANGVSAQEMVDTGLVASREGDPLTYDRFRNRVMFPITDFRGRIIGFGGRALTPDVPAKYLNSPETELFQKRLVLYNGMEARKAARDGRPVIVVEGYLDVIAAVMAGFEGTVAPMGTAMTEDHVALLWRMTDEPILCFDGDAAGQRAAERAANLVMPLLTPGKTVRIATLPEGLDPDDLIRQQGRTAFAEVLDQARSLSDVVWSLETGGMVPETPEARAALEARLRERANGIGDQSVRRHYMQAFDEKLAAFFQPVRPASRFDGRRGERRSGMRRGYGQEPLKSPRLVVSDTLRNSRLLKPARSEASPREAVILMSLVNHPALAENRLESLAGLDFASPGARKLAAALLDIIMADHDISGADLRAALAARGFGAEIERMEALLRGQGVWQVLADAAVNDAEIGLRHALALHYKSVELNKALKAAENALDVDWTEDSFRVLQDIKNQITTVDGTEALIEGFGSLSGRAARSF